MNKQGRTQLKSFHLYSQVGLEDPAVQVNVALFLLLPENNTGNNKDPEQAFGLIVDY